MNCRKCPVNYHKYLGDDIAVYPPCYQRTPSAPLHYVSLRSSPSKRDSAVGLTEPLGRWPKGKAMNTFDIVVRTLPQAGGVPVGGGGAGKLLTLPRIEIVFTGIYG